MPSPVSSLYIVMSQAMRSARYTPERNKNLDGDCHYPELLKALKALPHSAVTALLFELVSGFDGEFSAIEVNLSTRSGGGRRLAHVWSAGGAWLWRVVSVEKDDSGAYRDWNHWSSNVTDIGCAPTQEKATKEATKAARKRP